MQSASASADKRGKMLEPGILNLYRDANLNGTEINQMPAFIDGSLDFYGTSAFDKLFEYFAFETQEMPYEVAKARTETPDTWILDFLEAYIG